MTDEDYTALKQLVGAEQLGLSATAELLQWRADQHRIQHAEESDREEAQRFWTIIDQQRQARALDPALGGRA